MAAEAVGDRLIELYRSLYEAYGPQGWWPAETSFEVIVGAILTQATAWRNAKRAVENLKSAGGGDLIPHLILRLDEKKLAELIRPSGYPNLKARRLKSFVEHLFKKYSGSLERMFSQDLDPLRDELLGIHGIGPETADTILLYAAEKPSFVVDAYTRRLLRRLGLIEDERIEYEKLRALFMENLPRDVALYNEYHALIVRHCKEVCRKRPLCYRCPINALDNVCITLHHKDDGIT